MDYQFEMKLKKLLIARMARIYSGSRYILLNHQKKTMLRLTTKFEKREDLSDFP